MMNHLWLYMFALAYIFSEIYMATILRRNQIVNTNGLSGVFMVVY